MIIEDMRKLSNSVLNILLACGLLFVFGGFLLFVYALENDHAHFFKFWPFFIMISGIIITYCSVTLFHKTHLLFVGIMLALSGCFSIFVARDITSLGLKELWPVFVFLAAISLVCSCIYRFRRARPNYIVPAVAMVLLGCIFFLFSLDIVKMSFVSFMVIAGPFLLFFSGIGVVVFYFVQSSHKELVVPEEEADNDE